MSENSRFMEKFLLRSCRNWDIHGGERYLYSNRMGDNVRARQDEADTSLTGTRADISGAAGFRAWMDSRAAQAKALSDDLALYNKLGGAKDGNLSEAEVKLVARNFGERAIMALYGVDESMYADRFKLYEDWFSERPYEETAENIGYLVESDSWGSIEELKSRLDGFAKDWEQVSREEQARAAVAYTDGVVPVCLTRLPGSDTVQPVYSVEYLTTYLAEYNGHAGYFGRMRDTPEEEIPYAYRDDGYKLFGPKPRPETPVNDGWASAYLHAQEGLERLDDIVRHPDKIGGSYVYDQHVFGLDAASLKKFADVDIGEYARMAAKEDHKKAAYVREMAWADRQDAAERELAGRPNTRDTRDLDVAAGGIEAGDNCAAPDLRGGDFGPF